MRKIALLLVLLVPPVLAQETDISCKATTVKDGIYVLEGVGGFGGGNVGLLVEEGMSEDKIVAANPLALCHDDYSWGFITTERMTRTPIRSLTAE